MADVPLSELLIILQDTLTRVDGLVFTNGAPSSGVGTLDSMALDVAAKVLYGPKTVAGWGAGTLLTGDSGPAIELQRSATHVQWRVVGTPTWVDLIPLADMKGADGKEVELQKSATHLQWRYAGAVDWTNLVPLDDITPAPVPGPAAWSPVIANVADGARRVQQITDWTGGGGTKPATGFIGATGLVATAALATDIRGAGGAGSGDMMAANNLSELTDVGAARTKLDVYSKAATDTALGGKQDKSEKGAANGYAGLDADGKVPAAQIPAVAITDTFPVASQGAMLALAAQVGDVAIRSDLSKSFILQAEPAATLANWKELLTPTVVVPVFATVAEVWTGSVTDKIVSPSVLNAAMIPTALAIAGGVVSPDCHAGINFDIASITANITIANLANKTGKLGRSGSITGNNDATAGRTVSLGTDWKKIGTTAFPTAANALWKLVYNVDGNGVNYSVMVLTA